MYKDLLGSIAIVLTLVAFFPYVQSILKGATKPHMFSWIIWGSTTFVVFLAQLADKGGVGAWPIGVSGIITLYVALLAYMKKSDNTIKVSDWWFLAAAMSSLPLWYLTANPLSAVIILTTVDLLGFGPTFTKAYNFPFEEKLTFFIIVSVRNVIAIAALEHYSLTTVMFPALTATACLIFVVMVMLRRRVFANG